METLRYRKLFDGKVLYHFCASKFWPSIKKNGLRYGRIPWGGDNGIKLIPGYQWLTTNAEFKQSWNEGSSLPYDRTEFRITIMLPNVEKFNLYKWTEYEKENPLYETLSSFGDPENWYLFKGVIIPYWMVALEKKTETETKIKIYES